ncbi:MAG: mannose-1-phosphate guanylyltransferase [Acidobacteria bacterium]|nr:mannose-1-phosphate guanylyltransferase [Acidobacteriota bacterium]
MSKHLYAVILAGGRGTRFWPRSRRRTPKQLMSFGNGRTLLQQTIDRLSPLISPGNVWVFTNQLLAKAVSRQLPEVPSSQIIAEPVQRNTAPCAGLAAELILARDPEAVLGVFPSDHVVLKPAAFRNVVRLAERQARLGNIVVLGIRPRWPETGYGYMEFSRIPQINPPRALAVKQFREKPNMAVAERYIRAKRFFWNSGMFFWKASVIRDALRQHLPETSAVLSSIGECAYRKNGKVTRILNDLYPSCQNISVDYAVLEKASNVVGIPCDIGWNDLGSWQAVYDLLPHDQNSNVLRSETLLLDSGGLYVDVPGKMVGAVGVQNLVIVETSDALLIVPRERAQDVTRLVSEIEKAGREELL